jgi:hypothetical protein
VLAVTPSAGALQLAPLVVLDEEGTHGAPALSLLQHPVNGPAVFRGLPVIVIAAAEEAATATANVGLRGGLLLLLDLLGTGSAASSGLGGGSSGNTAANT